MANATAKGRKSNAEKAELPALDLNALALEDTEMPAITREREERPNPFVDALAATYKLRQDGNEKAGKAVTVPTARAGEVKYLIRQGAKKLGIGARIAESQVDEHVTRIFFCGKEKRATKNDTQAAPTE